jgi:hypothetical protein
MSFTAPPESAAWVHRDARSGFEVVYFQSLDGGHLVTGCTTALEDDQTWVVDYAIRLDPQWRTRHALVRGRSSAGLRTTELETAGDGRWDVNGRRVSSLDGCLDVDLESSAMTNTLPVHRLGLSRHEKAEAPAAYVRAVDLGVQRLEQEYVRIDDDGPRQRYHYSAAAFAFTCDLTYDESGLVLSYPGIAERAA